MPDSKTMKVGLLGWPVAHSLSPVIHQAAFNKHQIDWQYELLPLEPQNFTQGIKEILASDIKGFNITAPYKQMIVPYLNHCDENSQILGAVNTVSRNEAGEWIGYNTDIIGLKTALSQMGVLKDSLAHVTVFGNGGVARAVLAVLNELHVQKIEILARNQGRSIELIDLFSGSKVNWKEIHSSQIEKENIEGILNKTALMINATTVGMKHNPQKSFFADGFAIPEQIKFLDLVYQPTVTQMMEQVSAAGGKAWNGIEMLIYQAAASYQIWTGKEAPVEVMKEAVLWRLEK